MLCLPLSKGLEHFLFYAQPHFFVPCLHCCCCCCCQVADFEVWRNCLQGLSQVIHFLEVWMLLGVLFANCHGPLSDCFDFVNSLTNLKGNLIQIVSTNLRKSDCCILIGFKIVHFVKRTLQRRGEVSSGRRRSGR